MKPQFSTLIILTLVSALILAPFAFSSWYVPVLREQAFAALEFLHHDGYKLATGFVVLGLVLAEMVLTVRKRGRRWQIKLPGTIQFWRSLHIFLGVGLLGAVLVHTGGKTGDNFNAIFLWVFFAVALSALVGVVAETGILESPAKSFNLLPQQLGPVAKLTPTVSKGPLIRGLRLIWLSSHIILVSIFGVMLAFHIFLAFFFQ